MKKNIYILFIFLTIVISSFAQSKKELNASIIQLQEEVTLLQEENKAIPLLQEQITKLEKQVEESRNDKAMLQKFVMEQSDRIAKLEKSIKALGSDNPDEASFDEKWLEGKTPEETAINTLMHNYMKANTPYDRYNYVILTDKVKEAMVKRYGTKIGSKDNPLPLLRADNIKILSKDITSYNKAIKVKTVAGNNSSFYYVVRTKDGYLIDWGGTNCVNDESWSEYLKSDSRATKSFKMMWSSYYSFSEEFFKSLNIGDSSNNSEVKDYYEEKWPFHGGNWNKLQNAIYDRRNEFIHNRVTIQVHRDLEGRIWFDKVVKWETSDY